MADSTVPVTFAVHSNPGAYAVLLGSGVSTGAGIPTGREIVTDLTAKIAMLEGAGAVEDPIEWYRGAHGRDPDYSQLLGELAPSPAERSQLLRTYFEPTDEHRQQGVRVPSGAHRAMAQLAASGHLRLFLTTNFDRLLEQALNDVGVVPTVISTPDSLEGAGPLAHSGCTIVKLNGDYRDSRIKNTPDELASYHHSFDTLLDGVLADFGLITSGWSADWDGALRDAFARCSNDRLSTYWTTVGTPGSHAQSVIDDRQAHVLFVDSADAFFAEIAAGVVALDGSVAAQAPPPPVVPAAPAAPVAAAPAVPEPPPVVPVAPVVQAAVAPESPPAVVPVPAATTTLLEAPPVQYALTESGEGIAYTAFGEGDVLFVVPCPGHLQLQWSQPEWQSLFTSLANGRRVIWFDYAGTGLSEHAQPEWSIDGVIATIDAIVAAEELEAFSMLGMADGGGYALAYAARYPQRVSKLLLYCVEPYRGAHGTSRAAALASLDWELFLNSAASWWGMSGDGAENLMTMMRRSWPSPERYLEFVNEVRMIDFGEVLADIECPTLVVQTQNQTLRVEAAGSVLAARIRNSQLVTPPGGQMLPLLDAEGPAIKLFDDFLA